MSTSVESAVKWYSTTSIVLVPGGRSLADILGGYLKAPPEWIVISHRAVIDLEYYAFQYSELIDLSRDPRVGANRHIGDTLRKMGWRPAALFRNGQQIRPSRSPGPSLTDDGGPSATRAVDLSSANDILRIGALLGRSLAEPPHTGPGQRAKPPSREAPPARHEIPAGGLGPMRGVDAPPPPPPSAGAPIFETPQLAPDGGLGPHYDGGLGPHGAAPASPMAGVSDEGAGAKPIDVTLSAETRSELEEGDSIPVSFRIELTAEAKPLASSLQSPAAPDKPIVVSLTVENDTLLIVGKWSFTFDPPTSGNPRTGKFNVAGNHVGSSRIAVNFSQGGTTLGAIGFQVTVVAEGAKTETARGKAQAAPRDLADDDKLALMIQQRVDKGGGVQYEYILHSEGLGLAYRKVSSRPLLDQGGSPAEALKQFIGRIYEKVTQELKSYEDLQELQRETRALGVSLCNELFDPEVTRILWPLRDRIQIIQIVSWEPYIPWELVRLKNPDTDEVDDRFLGEYGLVRTLSDTPPPRTLPLTDWSYLGAVYPFKSLPDVGAEMDFFTGTGPNTLHTSGIVPRAIEPTRDAFYSALGDGSFDVLHISCHAESPHGSIDNSRLIITDDKAPGDTGPRLIAVDSDTVANEAKLKKRQSLVFLNGCETGRVAPVLTQWGGWPNVFLRAGAGAFVGSSWPVRDKPAAVFCETFYTALLNGKMLFEAAAAAREAAKNLGDASWLAYKVYGHPRAKRQM